MTCKAAYLHRIADQVDQNLLQALVIAVDHNFLLILIDLVYHIKRQVDLFDLRLELEQIFDVLYDLAHLNPPPI